MRKILNILVTLVFLCPFAATRTAASSGAQQPDSAVLQTTTAVATATTLGSGEEAAEEATALADSVTALHRQIDNLAWTVQTLRDDSVTKKQMCGYMLALAAVFLVILLTVYAKLSAAVSRKSSGKADGNSSDNTRNAEMQAVKKRVADAEQRVALVEAANEKLAAAVAARPAAQPVLQGKTTTKVPVADAAGSGVFYAKALSLHGTLDVSKQNNIRREEAVFEFRHTDAVHAKFAVCANDRMMRWAIENRQTVLEPACDIISDDGASRVETITEGEAQLENGSWRVMRRAHIIIR